MSNLFKPVTIGTLTVKNRFVRSATQDWLGNEDGSITEQELVLYHKLAEGNVGLIMSGHAYVEHPRGRASSRQNGIYKDKFVAGYSRVAQMLHQYDSKFVVQLAHAGVQTNSELTEGVVPADPNQLTTHEINSLIDDFILAAKRVQMAGCDGVQIHMAHGYLLARFLSPDTNSRVDEWGGSLEKRAKLPIAIVKRIRQAVGNSFPILVKLNSCGGFAGTAEIELADVVNIAKMLEQAGVNAIEVSGGVVTEPQNSLSRINITKPEDEAYFAQAAKAIKAAVNIPVILVGGLRSCKIMEEVLTSGTADMIAMSRPFIREPDIINRLADGQDKVKCISCNKCRDFNGIHCIFEK